MLQYALLIYFLPKSWRGPLRQIVGGLYLAYSACSFALQHPPYGLSLPPSAGAMMMTQIQTQNRKRAGGGNGDNSARKHPTLEQTRPESVKKPLPAPLTAAHNPKVVGSNPAPATKEALKSQDFRASSLLLSENNLGQKMGQHFDPCADPYGETIL